MGGVGVAEGVEEVGAVVDIMQVDRTIMMEDLTSQMGTTMVIRQGILDMVQMLVVVVSTTTKAKLLVVVVGMVLDKVVVMPVVQVMEETKDGVVEVETDISLTRVTGVT